MKQILLYITIFTILTTGCCIRPQKNDAIAIFSSKPFGKHLITTDEKHFKKGQKIYFGAYSKQGFGSGDVRIQIIKKSEKTNIYGYTIEHARDIQIDVEKNYFQNCFHIYNDGYYYLRIFIREKPHKPIVENYFWIN